MTAADLLADLAGRGVQLWAEGGALRFRAPREALTPELRALVAARKGELLALLAPQAAGIEATRGRAGRVVPDPAALHRSFPLTEVQQAYWLGRSGAFELGDVSAHLYLEVEAAGLDLGRLEAAWARVLERHPMLCAVVLPDGTQQILERAPGTGFHVLDLRGEEPATAAARLAALRGRLAHEGPAPERWPLFEIVAARLPDGRVRVHWSTSLLVCDALSFRLLFDETLQLYVDPAARLPALDLSFRDCVLALAARTSTESYARALAAWRERLPTLPGAPELPLARPPAALARPRFVRRQAGLAPAAWARFKERAARAGVTPSAALCTAYAAVLARWSRQPHFLLNLLFFNRPPLHEQVDRVVGNFSSTLLLEVDLTSVETFAARAGRLQSRLLRDLDCAEVSGVRVLRELNQLRGGSLRANVPVVFASTLNLGAALEPAADPAPGSERGLDLLYGCLQTPQVWLDHQVAEREGALAFNWDAVEDLFPAGLMDDMFEAYRAWLERLAGEGGEAWEETGLPPVPAAQLAARAAVNATAAPLPGLALHAPFEEQAARHPERPAVIAGGEIVTYGELDALAGALAARLQAAGARPETLVAVVLDKGWEQAAAALAVLAAGAAYLPIHPGLPAERRRYLLEHGGAHLALATPQLATDLEWPAGVGVLAVERGVGGEPTLPISRSDTRPDQLAYVIYTSGSTGLPKGVAIEHRGAVNTVLDVNRRFGIGPDDRVLALSALSFDLSVWDLFGLLGAGGAVVMPVGEEAREPALWLDLLRRHRVTVWNTVPALMEMLVDHVEGTGGALPLSLRAVLLSGDWIPVGLPDRIRRLAPGIRVVSLGGATEASIWSILYDIGEVAPGWTSIPYGRPMDNQTFHVLDDALEPRPVWVPGQLYIGGAGLARCYWRDPEKTRAAFLVHPRTGERLYRTGDLGRWLPDGNLEFLGREDAQVKVGGYRIELGEIEAVLAQHPAVRAAAAAALGEARGQKRLVGYVVPREASGPTAAELRAFLAERLPEYMVPAALVELDALPLGPNGKVDRRALPPPERAREEKPAGRSAPRDELEARLAAIWEQVLDVRPVGVGDDFFELGGHSLLAVRLLARVRAELGRDLPLAALFERGTVESLAALLRAPAAAAERPSPLVPIQPRGEGAPLFFVHPVGGSVLGYADLARALGPGRPLYGLQSVPAEDGPAPETIEEMADLYLAAVREVQPRGPYRLGGWSMGGLIAFEMARRLREAGEEVALLALLDTAVPEGGTPPVEGDLAAWFARDLGGLAGRELELPTALRTGLSADELLILLEEQARAAGALPPEIDSRLLARLYATFRTNARAIAAYRPRPCSGPLLLVRAEHGLLAGEDDPAGGWDTLVGPVEVATVPGDHFAVVRPPAVAAVAGLLAGR